MQICVTALKHLQAVYVSVISCMGSLNREYKTEVQKEGILAEEMFGLRERVEMKG